MFLIYLRTVDARIGKHCNRVGSWFVLLAMKRLSLLLAFCIATPGLFAQQKQETSLTLTIDSIVKQQQWASEAPGVAVGVLVNGKVVFQKGYGVQRLNSTQSVGVHSDFHMASVSKPFAATAILQLAEKGKLHIDSTLVHYLPYFTMKDQRYRQITLLHMLTHSSGIPDVSDYEWEKPQVDEAAAERYAKSFATMELDFAPGSKFNYSNAAYNLFAAVIGKVSGLSFEEYMRQHVFTRTGMNNSSFILQDVATGRRTDPHVMDQQLVQTVSKVYPYNRIHAPSSTLHSNVEDMLKWLEVYNNRGAAKDQSIIGQDTWASMLQPRLKVNDQYSVCLSWFKTMIGEHEIFFHSGGDLGYRSFAGFDPEHKVAVVVMGNNEGFDATATAFSIFRSVLLQAPVVAVPKPVYWELRKPLMEEGIDKAKEVYYTLKKQQPGNYNFNAGSLETLANLLYDRGYKQQAADVLIFCTELEPGVWRWYEYLGDVYRDLGKKEEAIKWFQKALAIYPSKTGLQEKIKALKQ